MELGVVHEQGDWAGVKGALAMPLVCLLPCGVSSECVRWMMDRMPPVLRKAWCDVWAGGGSIPAKLAKELDGCGVKKIYSTNGAFAALCGNGAVRTWGDNSTQPQACVALEPITHKP